MLFTTFYNLQDIEKTVILSIAKKSSLKAAVKTADNFTFRKYHETYSADSQQLPVGRTSPL